ncbi:hypothetical protein SDC9_07470 [bioreactor metagenome]|uniref:Uncharacterized protein n=1 Tax=bioreactor metagenome TaxID=1076179 RepID=A0A644T7I3_9ZZZZ|nr:hypothetical protein [Methanobrevibacter sp.]MEA4956926.1 hypothetical protein [Methanobrevibacter sp.]
MILTGEQRKEIVKDVLREIRSIEIERNDSESIGTFRANVIASFLNQLGSESWGFDWDRYKLDDIELEDTKQ